MKIKNFKSNIILFVIVLIVVFLAVKLTGGFRTSIIKSISFSEAFEKLPLILIISFLLVFTINYTDRKK